MDKSPPVGFTQEKFWHPFVGPFDPCSPIEVKSYQTPPQLYLGFQPPGLDQFSPREALFHGTLWPALASTYFNEKERAR